MNQMTTITSKKQLTLPAALFRKLGLKEGQKVMVSEENGRLVLTPAEAIVEELAGSITPLTNWHGKNMDQIVEESKQDYFQSKYK